MTDRTMKMLASIVKQCNFIIVSKQTRYSPYLALAQ